jgi:hypothetical protein
MVPVGVFCWLHTFENFYTFRDLSLNCRLLRWKKTSQTRFYRSSLTFSSRGRRCRFPHLDMVQQLGRHRAHVLSRSVEVQAEIEPSVEHDALRHRTQSAVETRRRRVERAAGVLLGERGTRGVVVGHRTVHVRVRHVQTRPALRIFHYLAEDHLARLPVLFFLAWKRKRIRANPEREGTGGGVPALPSEIGPRCTHAPPFLLHFSSHLLQLCTSPAD